METHTEPWSGRLGQVIGYLLAWTAMTLALTFASRSLHIGPGFANPLPYAGLAMAINQSGLWIRKWLAR
jgi:hypothetical protein